MPITSNDQLHLLYDILTNHKIDCCGSMSECQQIQRIVQSLVNDQSLSYDMKNTLKDIYNYSKVPENNQHLEHHIVQHNGHLDNWISSIDSFTNQQF
ncbi:hypothetical protein CIB95_13385 [Lottiidibacillus patelloidae]|uniref:YtzH-like protein n=1 Tax=Lottiidibacillus patelloidae TaxID=2670334 RepID=A0A263BSC8_9BACI|nr:YtzH-like family protein [Lottiidibacillus patelloidae]OZM56096.1 hypothetical protein CIB95_13385 [Lottiidibacillus patelloidae]